MDFDLSSDLGCEEDAAITMEPEFIEQLVNDLFMSMLNLPVYQIPAAPETPSEDTMEARIRVSGDWQAEMRIRGSRAFAARIAATMFSVPEADVTPEETSDALGEVINVIGGNAKGIMNRDSKLTIPEVVCGDTCFEDFNCEIVQHYCLADQGFTVRLHELGEDEQS